MKLPTRTVITLALLLPACGGGEKKEDAAAAGSIAKALAYESKERAAAKKADEERLAKIAAEKAEAERKETELREAIAAVAVLPETMPKNIGKACDDVVAAYEQFMRDNRDAEKVMIWFNEKKKNLGKQRGVCLKTKVEAAACLTHALQNAPDALYDMGEEGVDRLKGACGEKFGVAAGAGD